MRDFLYLSPYFPPQSRVGAIRPLKFARHLPALGWRPVILADLWPGAGTSAPLLDAVPPDVPVIRDYSARADGTFRAFLRGAPSPTPSPSPTAAAPRRLAPSAQEALSRLGSRLGELVPDALRNPELIPLDDHAAHAVHALRAARRILRAYRCEAIVVNADPYSSLVLGARLARESGLPLIQDLRDPWSVCELRRPLRPTLSAAAVDRLERWAVEAAHTVILNTEQARDDYRAHYPDIAAERFTTIRNHGDAGLTGSGTHQGFDRFTLLFLGHFRRFVEGDVLLRALAILRARGVSSDRVQLVVTGDCPEATRDVARSLGVEDMLVRHPFVPYHETGAIMDSADLLVLLNNRTRQRVPAKLYDYATSQRPILAVADSPELERIVSGVPGAHFRGLDDAEGVADVVERELALGRQRVVARGDVGLSSREASAKLAAILDAAAAGRR
jgi:hypothetical protein